MKPIRGFPDGVNLSTETKGGDEFALSAVPGKSGVIGIQWALVSWLLSETKEDLGLIIMSLWQPI